MTPEEGAFQGTHHASVPHGSVLDDPATRIEGKTAAWRQAVADWRKHFLVFEYIPGKGTTMVLCLPKSAVPGAEAGGGHDELETDCFPTSDDLRRLVDDPRVDVVAASAVRLGHALHALIPEFVRAAIDAAPARDLLKALWTAPRRPQIWHIVALSKIDDRLLHLHRATATIPVANDPPSVPPAVYSLSRLTDHTLFRVRSVFHFIEQYHSHGDWLPIAVRHERWLTLTARLTALTDVHNQLRKEGKFMREPVLAALREEMQPLQLEINRIESPMRKGWMDQHVPKLRQLRNQLAAALEPHRLALASRYATAGGPHSPCGGTSACDAVLRLADTVLRQTDGYAIDMNLHRVDWKGLQDAFVVELGELGKRLTPAGAFPADPSSPAKVDPPAQTPPAREELDFTKSSESAVTAIVRALNAARTAAPDVMPYKDRIKDKAGMRSGAGDRAIECAIRNKLITPDLLLTESGRMFLKNRS